MSPDLDALLVTPDGEPWASHGALVRYESLSPAARYALAILAQDRIRVGYRRELGAHLALLSAAVVEHTSAALLDLRARRRFYDDGISELEARGVVVVHRREAEEVTLTARFNRVVVSERLA